MSEIEALKRLIIKEPKFTSYQKKILESEKRFTVTEASTKSGKTFSHIFWLFKKAHEGEPGQEFWWVAPIYSQAEIAFNRMREAIAPSGLYIINISKLSITTPVGTIIRFKSAEHPDGLYGENVYAFVFDEFSRAREEAWFALRTTISYTRGEGKFIGNVTGKNWAWKLARKAESGEESEFDYFRITAREAVAEGILAADEIEKARRELPSRVYKMLYEAEFTQPEGALWSWELIDNNRESLPENLKRIVVGVDPSGSGKAGSDEAGIIVAGIDGRDHGYIIEDASGVMSPNEWGLKAVALYHRYRADRIVAEVNQGWDMVESIIKNIDRTVPVKKVVATRGKVLRAEPVVALYEQGKVHHTKILTGLEDEMINWIPEDKSLSPGRIDALVWALTELMIKNKQIDFFVK